jgi:O-antigen ligase
LSVVVNDVSRADIDAKLLSILLAGSVSFGVLLSGFVIREPAPYELYMAGLMAVLMLLGLTISRTVAPLLVLLVLFNIGGMISMTQMAKLGDTPLYLAVSLFLALTAVFFAAVVESYPRLYGPIFHAWTVAGVATSALGIAGYFHALPGAEIFTRFERAAGAFQDPNVFGPFLTLPAIYLLHRLIAGRVFMMPLYALPLLVLIGGIFLSFSRGAWGLFALSAGLLMLGMFVSNRSGRFRLRIILMGFLAIGLIVLALLILLQIPEIAERFSSRAQLAQDYDSARLGRFARYGLGFQMAMENPLGIGPLVFGQIFGEDTHNIWLKALLDYGWQGFASYLLLIVWTIAGGLRILFRERLWQPYLLCVYVVFIAHVGLGSIIDTDHWRHFYLLLGLIWGAMALEWRHQHAKRTGFPRSSLKNARGG